MSGIKNNFEKRIAKKAKEAMKDAFQQHKNEIFSFMEMRLLTLTEEVANLELKLKGNSTNILIKVCKVNEKASDLIYKKKFDSGMDIASMEEVIVPANGGEVLVPSGIALAIPTGYEVQLRPKSSNKKFLVKLGTIDSGFRNEIKIAIINPTSEDVKIEPHKAIAQLVINKIAFAGKVQYVDSLDKLPVSARGKGGFGSTKNIISVPVKKLDFSEDRLLELSNVIDTFNYELPLEINTDASDKKESLLEVSKVYLNRDEIKAVVDFSDKMSHVSDNIFLLNAENYKLNMFVSELHELTFSLDKMEV